MEISKKINAISCPFVLGKIKMEKSGKENSPYVPENSEMEAKQ